MVTGGTGVDSVELPMSRPPSQGAAVIERDAQYLMKIKRRVGLDMKRTEANRQEIDKLLQKLINLLWTSKRDATNVPKVKKSA